MTIKVARSTLRLNDAENRAEAKTRYIRSTSNDTQMVKIVTSFDITATLKYCVDYPRQRSEVKQRNKIVCQNLHYSYSL
jgi:hypothetical protein